jgi:predicted AAA+ superfamily ATPase
MRNAKHPSTFLDSIFKGKLPAVTSPLIADDLIKAVLSGGYPEAVARASDKRRQDWYLNYIDAIVQRDINEIAKIEQAQQIPRLLQALAHQSGQLINYSKVGSLLDMNSVTTQKYTGILEQLFLVAALSPWHTNRIKRLVKSPKLHFLDSGLLAALQDITLEKVKKDRRAFGPLLETFVFTELQKLSSWNDNRYEFSHFRDKQQNEVDIVLQNRRGQIVGIEVKASATVSHADFSGLRKLADAHPKDFVLGLVLYDHDQTIPFGEQLIAAPISTLWH